jgi:Ni/Fe-hydrogenase subunit HybB-like protein
MDRAHFDRLTVGLGKAASIVLFTYFALKLIGVAHGNSWGYLATPYGYWFLLEILGFVLLPAFLYAYGVRTHNVRWVRGTSILTVVGIALNRVNHTLVAFNWNAEERYFPHWMEVTITITIITIGILTFRWIVNRMPILYDHPDFSAEAH